MNFSPAEAHLRLCDPVLAAAMERVASIENPLDAPANYDAQPLDAFSALCRIIVGQQLSVAVARAIWRRFETHFPLLTPEIVAQTSLDDLRTLGLSRAKTTYLHSLAAHIREGKLEISAFPALSDEEIRAEIVAVKGLGPWSADMFLMFELGRPDILPVGDLGIREAMRRLYNLETRPSPAEMERISAPWRPFRTLACRYLWRWLDFKD